MALLGDSANKEGTSTKPHLELPPLREQKTNFLTYAQTQFDSFEERPFCEVDSLVFSWLVYYRLSEALQEQTQDGNIIELYEWLRAEDFDAMMGSLWDVSGSHDLLYAVCSNPRYRGTCVTNYESIFNKETEEQFAAMSFLLPNGDIYVAYRGTDSTLVGWKEDFNLSFQCPVQSQESARIYLEKVGSQFPGAHLYVGGHSKGGNLAVYAAITCNSAMQSQIAEIYSHDGPGFNEQFLQDARFTNMHERVAKTLPQSSIIGMIFEDQEDYDIVESTAFSITQHDPFSWVVDGTEFKKVEKITVGARYFDKTLNAWMSGLTPEQRGQFIDTIASIINVTGATTFAEVRENWKTTLPQMLEAASELDSETRQHLTDTLAAFAKTMLGHPVAVQ